MTEQTSVEALPYVSGADRHRTIVRLVAGGIGEGVDRLMAIASSLDAADVESDTVEPEPIHADPTMMAILGWVSEIPIQVKAVADSTSRVTYPVTRTAEVVWDTAAFVARATGATAFVEGFTEPFLVAWQEERERLASVGTAEYARGRVLVVEVFEQSVGGIMGFIGESEELGDLVREQTLGITGSAVREIRETGAAADGLTEGIFRRLLGRDARTVPPIPATASE